MKKGYSFIKMETLTQVFSSEFNEIFKSVYIEEHLRTTASVSFLKLKTKSQTFYTKCMFEIL